MDGTQKLPQRLLGTWRDNDAAGRPGDLLTLAVAAWIRFASGTDRHGKPIDVRDPLKAKMAEIAARAGDDPARMVDAFLGLEAVFGTDLPHQAEFRQALTWYLAMLNRDGAAAAIELALAGA
jgi:fructuronate reductase